MNRKEEIKKIWTECFDDSAPYVKMYFERVYRDEDAMLLESGSTVVSSLLLQQYAFLFHGQEVTMGYIAGAATKKEYRGRGFMGQLLRNALLESNMRGQMCCSLIPAHDWLYYYYEKYGFTTVFFRDPQRFTSLHTFPVEEPWTEVPDHYSDAVYQAMSRMERERACGVLHSHRDFLNILADLELDRGRMVVVSDGDGAIRAMGWAVVRGSMVEVRDLLADTDAAAQGVLHAMRSYYPGLPFKVLAAPVAGDHRLLYKYGMSRIVNVEQCLSIIAAANPKWKSKIRVFDPIIESNSHSFVIADGRCLIDDSIVSGLDFDVNITTFTDIVFSSRAIGDILCFPSVRPYMSMMLD